MEMISVVERSVSHHREYGKFLVVYHNNVKLFNGLVSAFIFYFNLDKEASLWDITAGEELLERKCFETDPV